MKFWKVPRCLHSTLQPSRCITVLAPRSVRLGATNSAMLTLTVFPVLTPRKHGAIGWCQRAVVKRQRVYYLHCNLVAACCGSSQLCVMTTLGWSVFCTVLILPSRKPTWICVSVECCQKSLKREHACPHWPSDKKSRYLWKDRDSGKPEYWRKPWLSVSWCDMDVRAKGMQLCSATVCVRDALLWSGSTVRVLIGGTERVLTIFC